MPTYNEGDAVTDAEPGTYEGIADAFCEVCRPRWQTDERRAHFEQLATEVDTGQVTVRRATQLQTREGGTEVDRAQPPSDQNALTDREILELATTTQDMLPGWSFAVVLDRAQVALWDGNERIYPAKDISATRLAWWKRHDSSVDARMRAWGWDAGTREFTEVTVTIGSDKRIAVVPKTSS